MTSGEGGGADAGTVQFQQFFVRSERPACRQEEREGPVEESNVNSDNRTKLHQSHRLPHGHLDFDATFASLPSSPAVVSPTSTLF